MATKDPASPLSLESTRYNVLSNAVRNVLRTDVALETYAQLIDGLPLAASCWDNSRNTHRNDHPVTQHKDLCPGALDKALDLREKFTIDDLTFSSKLIEAFNAAPFFTKEFNRLIVELTARALHQIGVYLYLQEDKLHDAASTGGLSIDEVQRWEYYDPRIGHLPLPPTLFLHHIFKADDQYPNGAADVAGYWAEDRILGGVPIFDRSQDWPDDNMPNIYFQSSRSCTPFFAWQLLDRQQERLLSFLLGEDGDFELTTRPIPILPRRKNKVRVHDEQALVKYSIYRDLYEREPPPEVSQHADRTCVREPSSSKTSDSED